MAGDSVGLGFAPMNPKQKITFHYYPCTGKKDNLSYPQQKKKKKPLPTMRATNFWQRIIPLQQHIRTTHKHKST
jgi:hypothetical protein